ncbi:MAG: hypothetical protein LBL01_04600 [Bifidobacteriaceae bacterium]|jgi:plasmid stability protein|nr:hypothetical protein [Bifidobacteriaceae bacterium]
MATLTVRNLDERVYEGLKELAAGHRRSMEAEARDLLGEGVRRRRRWVGAKLADLSGGPEIWDVATPYARSAEPPRDAGF